MTFLRPGVALSGLICIVPLQAQAATDPAQVAAEMNAAVNRVKEIVNQPVRRLTMGDAAQAALFQPGWFHPGALTPDFEHVDIRASQEFAQYAQWPFVTSDVTPGFMFVGTEVEFNAMTKFFYTDRSLPKAKLTEQEMLEINDLYRVIGKCLKQLREVQARPAGAANLAADTGALGVMAPLVIQTPPPAGTGNAAPDSEWGLGSPQTLAGLGALLVVLLAWLWVRMRRV